MSMELENTSQYSEWQMSQSTHNYKVSRLSGGLIIHGLMIVVTMKYADDNSLQ